VNPFMFRLFVDVAEHLSGKRVHLELKNPFWERARGSCYVDFSGTSVIRVLPELWLVDKRQFLKTFLHEVSHVKRHASGLLPSTGDVLPVKRKGNLQGLLGEVRDNLDEVSADVDAEMWLSFVQDEDTIAGKLFGLLKVS